MKKKILSLSVLALTMCLASCGESQDTPTNSQSQEEADSSNLSQSQEKEETLLYQRINSDGESDSNGNYVLFGSYPQSKVTDTSILGLLNNKVSEVRPMDNNPQDFTSYKYYIGSSNTTDYMWYYDIDFDNDGSYDYRCVYFDQYRPYCTSLSSSRENSYQDDNEYNAGNYYYFKYEPIKWKILKEDNGKATLLADLILDSQEYNYTSSSQIVNGETIYANNYEYSSIRKWLNDNFYNTAFNELQKSIINQVELDNSESSTQKTPNQYACNNTLDKVWLLSYQESANVSSNDRMKEVTEYAKCQASYVSTDSLSLGLGIWWLRSPFESSENITLDVIVNGSWNRMDVDFTSNGVVPTIELSL